MSRPIHDPASPAAPRPWDPPVKSAPTPSLWMWLGAAIVILAQLWVLQAVVERHTHQAHERMAKYVNHTLQPRPSQDMLLAAQ
ncbi:hypothetical protein QY917_01835 [Diaphorobacter sp. C33]|uniref:Uncharacterized protein n=2 Tax=Diaphorobacter nitroreducens TaxID=164759 RepID=A0AAX1WZW0_9BURK|nr:MULTISPECIES: hypothetical protein [Diaphorobacter]ROR51019.1 hypothetical protein EDC60_0782 [Diaphorobacter nitroreducens]TFI45335.1 hypothetical protein E4O93_20300 [Diaphorobacter sp. DS2]WKK89933.1 hypothetical protein QY917_01835 [Diaphorobacter sp. C33]